jgi:hypothetical protein
VPVEVHVEPPELDRPPACDTGSRSAFAQLRKGDECLAVLDQERLDLRVRELGQLPRLHIGLVEIRP